MANELILGPDNSIGTGLTIRAIVRVGATRWNGSALVLPSTIADGSWATGAITCTEQASGSSTANGVYVGNMPAITSSNIPVFAYVEFYDTASPTPQTWPIGKQSGWYDGNGWCVAPATDSSGNVRTVTALTNAPSDSSGVTSLLNRLTGTRAGYLDNLLNGVIATQSDVFTYGAYAQGLYQNSVLRASTTQSGSTSTTVKLDASASATDDLYNGLTVTIYGGTGAGQTRTITDYNGTSKVATVSPAWTTTPGTGANYSLASCGGVLPSTGLDFIVVTAPSGQATTFPQMLVAVYRWFFKKRSKTATQIKTYADDGSTALQTMAYTSVGHNETINEAS